eukprot:3256586-Pyramimonas_sp.AAC.1
MNRLRVWGSKIKTPAVVHPLLVRNDKLFVPIHENLLWLRRCCDERKGQTHWTKAFQYAVTKLRESLQQGVRQASDPARAAAESARDSLAMDSDDDEQPSGKRRHTAPKGLESVRVDIAG